MPPRQATPPADNAGAEVMEAPEAPTGIDNALAALVTHDPDAMILWRANGPRRSRIVALAGLMAEVDGVRSMFIVQGYNFGGFKMFMETNIMPLSDLPQAAAETKDEPES